MQWAVALLLAINFGVWLFSRGATISVSSNVPDAIVELDGRSTRGGTVQFSGVPFGERRLALSHSDYEPAQQLVNVGWFTGHAIRVEMKPLMVRLTVRTEPGAELLLNGNLLGAADSRGHFEKPDVLPGEYRLSVRLPGYTEWSGTLRLRPTEQGVDAPLQITPERQRQIEEKRAEMDRLLRVAQSQYTIRQYAAALQTVESALRIDPRNGLAQQLKERIVQTMNILK